MSEVHPLSKELSNGTSIRFEEQTVRIAGLIHKQDGVVVYRVQDEHAQDSYLAKIANPSEDPQAYEWWKRALPHEAQALKDLKAANLAERHHLPLLHALSKVHIIEEHVEHIYAVALLTQFPQGENVAHMLRKQARAGERASLRIGAQVAQVMKLAHQEDYPCGSITPERLYWDNINQHVTVVDWYEPQEPGLHRDAARKQAETRALALLIYWIMTGQRPAQENTTISHPAETMSQPLWNILEQAINQPAALGSEPATRLGQELTRLLRYWDTPDLFSHTEQYVNDKRRQQRSADLSFLQGLADQVAIGTLKEPERPWQNLIEASNDLLEQPLEQVRVMIVDGNFSQALMQTRSISIWPSIHLRALWRQRIAEIGVADQRLASDPTLGQYRTNMGLALQTWDRGDYTIPEWLQQLGSLFTTQVILTPAAQTVMQRLAYELQIAGLTARFNQANDVATRLQLIETLEQLALPEGIDSQIIAQRQQVISERVHISEEHMRQQSEQQQNVFRSALQQLQGRINAGDATLRSADFETILRLAPSPESRQKALDAQSIWNGVRFIRTLPEHNDIAEAVRHFVRLRRLNAAPELLAELDPFIATEALRQFGIAESSESIVSTFDRILQQPRLSFDALVQHRRWLFALLPAVDAQRRLLYDNLLKKENQARQNLDILDSGASPQEQTEALEQLRKQGIVSLPHLYLRVIEQSQLQHEQETYHQEITGLFEEVLHKLRSFSPAQSQVPSSFRDDVAAIREGILASKTTGLREKHRYLWEHTAHFVPDFEDLFYQHIYFAAQQAAADFKKLWDADARQGTPEGVQSFDSLMRAIDNAYQIYRLQAILEKTAYAGKLTAFITERRDQLDIHIGHLLRFDSASTPLEQQSQFLVKARRYIAVYDAFGGLRPGTINGYSQTALQALIAQENPLVVRAVLRYLPLDMSEQQIETILLAQDTAGQPSPLRQTLPLLAAGLVIVFVIGLLVGATLL